MGEWILFSEKVPPAWEKVLITVKDYDDHGNECGRHIELTYDKGQYKDYVAWMPLPKPYAK